MSVQENGSGNIDPLWFQVISSDDTFYSSKLRFCPKRQTYGALVFFETQLPCNFLISVNTALVTAKNSMHLRETNIHNLGTGMYETVTQSLASTKRCYGKICGIHTKTGLDDIQIKAMKHFSYSVSSLDIYALLGIPTGAGSKAQYVLEPLVGSKHVQLGLGAYYYRDLYTSACAHVSFASELKWRYGLAGTERRLYDLKKNGQWSRYLLFVHESDKNAPYFASNNLALKTKVTPRNSLDFYCAFHACHDNWHAELGYDFWFRNQEKTCIACPFVQNVGIADLVGIAALDPKSASTARIAQSVQPGNNQIVSDTSFIPVTTHDINLHSGAAPQSISNSFYGSLAYKNHHVQIGVSAAYEFGHRVNAPDNVYGWVNFDMEF